MLVGLFTLSRISVVRSTLCQKYYLNLHIKAEPVAAEADASVCTYMSGINRASDPTSWVFMQKLIIGTVSI